MEIQKYMSRKGTVKEKRQMINYTYVCYWGLALFLNYREFIKM